MLKKILIVEDNPVNLIILKKILESVCLAESAKSGAKAIEMLDENQYDLVLMDINLGNDDLTGTDVLKKIRSNPALKDMPVIAITAYAQGENAPNFWDEGFTDMLPKPISRDQLLVAIQKYLS